MRYRLYIVLSVALTMAVMAAAVAGATTAWFVGLCVALLVVIALLARAVHAPLKAAENGMYLLRDQDFASRLRPTGQPDADKIVELYNTLIDSMRAERLKNLEQERFLSQVVDASPLGIAVCDFDGAVSSTNRAWDKMQTPALTRAIDSVADGTSATVRVSESLIVRISRLWFMDKGFRRRFILVERLTEEIAAAQKHMFNTIVRTIGHEVNNSLGSVMSVLESLADMHADDPLTAGAITGCSAGCKNLVAFVRGYSDIVKLPAPVMESVDTARWLTSLRSTLAALAADFGAGATLRLTLPDRPIPATFDPMLMERVLINIVKNAAESIAAGPSATPGLITVTLTQDGAACRLAVTDNGRGITADGAQRLFTPFYSTKHPDRGLGLMLVADILRAHRSSFTLTTSPATRLTTFALTLPPATR